MSLERKIVAAALSSRSAHDRIAAAAGSEDNYSPYTGFLLKLIEKYYERDKDAVRVDASIIEEQIKAAMPGKNTEIYTTHLKECMAQDVSAINVADLVVDAKRKSVGNLLASALLDSKAADKVSPLIEQYTDLDVKDEDEKEEDYSNISVANVVEDATDKEGLIKLLPAALDRACKGKTKAGHHIVLFARPETGKTALTLTVAWGLCLQSLPVILFGNEEPVRDTILRAQCCFTGMTEEQIIADPAKAQGLLDKRGWKYLRFIPLSPGTPKQIEMYVKRYKPAAFVVDQIRNLNVGAETRVNQLEMAATAVRNIAKRHGALGISVTQAGDSANNKLFLEMGDVDFSNTGIPATADLMVGLGVNADYEAQGMRGISCPKNKIGGVHMTFPVKIRTDISRLEDI